ncbi:MAG: DNA-directed RNA polymerase subunit omega [Bacteroidales bacterium]|jgi:DNA-directed RNA polymerase subunit K/omega|nr:DNA-directed RNA polymerase subunit omega [Bacteroidales bacterium]
MEIRKNVPGNTVTRDISKLAEPTGNIYESVMIISKRANQISAEMKFELTQKLDEFSNYADTLEETFENREQIEISRYYERLPKASLIAVNEFEEDRIHYRKIEE